MQTSFSITNENFGELQVRSLVMEDLPNIVDVENRSHLTPWSEANFKSSISSNHLSIGLFDNAAKLLSYAVVSIVAGEAELLLFVVDEKYHGKKIGKDFLKSLLSQLERSVGTLFLEVRAGNRQAISLYETLGFNQVGERPRYYLTPWGKEDALIYAYEFYDGLNL